jgi:hypothetical protein
MPYRPIYAPLMDILDEEEILVLSLKKDSNSSAKFLRSESVFSFMVAVQTVHGVD